MEKSKEGGREKIEETCGRREVERHDSEHNSGSEKDGWTSKVGKEGDDKGDRGED